jgi:hypothetical protein
MDCSFEHLSLKPDEVDTVIYHGGCTDGFGAAFSAWLYLSKKFPERTVEYVPLPAGSDRPPDVTDKCVLICDTSFKFNTTTELIKKAKKLAVLDHHKTAVDELSKLPDQYKMFRMDRSGAYLAWAYFFGEKSVPKLIQYIQDNDLWTKKLPDTCEITAFLFTVEFDFHEFEKLMDDSAFDEILPHGKGMVRQNDFYVKTNLNWVAPKFMEIGGKFYFVGHINATTLKSEMGNRMLNTFKLLDFSVAYSINDFTNGTSFSLRSMDDRADCSRIAKLFGGGGHRNASGAKSSMLTTTLPATVLDNFKLYETVQNIYVEQTALVSPVKGVEETDELKTEHRPIRIVYLNSTQCKRELARYLVQVNEDAVDVENRVQTCTRIMRLATQSNDKFDCDMSAIWNYDGKTQKTWYTVVLAKFDEPLFTKLKTMPDFALRDGSCTFTLPGLQPILNLSKN